MITNSFFYCVLFLESFLVYQLLVLNIFQMNFYMKFLIILMVVESIMHFIILLLVYRFYSRLNSVLEHNQNLYNHVKVLFFQIDIVFFRFILRRQKSSTIFFNIVSLIHHSIIFNQPLKHRNE
jgi:hypothetical protein